jgi:hypothetical protein
MLIDDYKNAVANERCYLLSVYYGSIDPDGYKYQIVSKRTVA